MPLQVLHGCPWPDERTLFVVAVDHDSHAHALRVRREKGQGKCEAVVNELSQVRKCVTQ